MNIHIREEKEEDYSYAEAVIRAAFWNVYKPGCDEHVMIHKLRKSEEYIPELDLLAEADGRIVGCVMGTKATIMKDKFEDRTSVVAVGPIGILPEWQGKGLGTKLMEQMIEKAKALGYKGLALYGNPAYYTRFGFVNARKYKVTMPNGNNIDEFMILELGENRMSTVEGKCFESSAFEVSKDELRAFEKKYTGKALEPEETLPQLDYKRMREEFAAQGAELSLTETECIGLSEEEKLEINPCGTYCGECEDYGVVCDGCRNREGKPIWYDIYSKEEACPYYICTAKSMLHDCSQCKHVPCNKFFEYPDPNMTDEFKQMWFKLRMENFNQLNRLRKIEVLEEYQDNAKKYLE